MGAVATSLGIASGNPLEGLLGAYLVNRYANGARAFDHSQDVFKFAGFAALLSTVVSATVGVGSLVLGGDAASADGEEDCLPSWRGPASGGLNLTRLLGLCPSGWRRVR